MKLSGDGLSIAVRLAAWGAAAILFCGQWTLVGRAQGQHAGFASDVGGLPVDQRLRQLSEYYGSSAYDSVDETIRGQPAGGASLADFAQLMQLIQNTVDSNWELDGGTDSMTPFVNGVWIDANGKMKTSIDDALSTLTPDRSTTNGDAVTTQRTESGRVLRMLPELGAFQQATDLRWVSLTELQQELAQRANGGTAASLSMEMLGGLTRIRYVVWDASNKQWFVGGPAGGLGLDPSGNLISSANSMPPVLLEDLLSVAEVVLEGRKTIGCSIDPIPENLARVGEYVQEPSSLQLLGRKPQRWVEEVMSTLGDQRAVYYGLRDDSPTAAALIIADKDMKEIGLGMKSGCRGLSDYFVYLDRFGQPAQQSMVRWWFAFHETTLKRDEAGYRYRLPDATVRVLSEQQWLGATGQRVATGQRDLAAMNFAKNFTVHFPELRQKYVEFGRLQHIYDLALAMQVVREVSRANDVDGLEGLTNPDYQPRLTNPLRWIESMARVHQTDDKVNVAMVSGGVSIDPARMLRESRIDAQAVPDEDALQQWTTTDHVSWWK